MGYVTESYKSTSISGGTAFTPNCAVAARQQIQVTDTTAFTVNAPTNPRRGMEITLIVYNNSGSSLGTITWDAVYVLSRSFVNPANGVVQPISFVYDGTNWVDVGRAEKGSTTALTQTYSTADATLATPTAAGLTAASGTADGTVADVGGAFSQTTLNNNFQDVATAYNALRADVLDLAQFVNSLVDILQAQKFVG
jgi:hypothetical protein